MFSEHRRQPERILVRKHQYGLSLEIDYRLPCIGGVHKHPSSSTAIFWLRNCRLSIDWLRTRSHRHRSGWLDSPSEPGGSYSRPLDLRPLDSHPRPVVETPSIALTGCALEFECARRHSAMSMLTPCRYVATPSDTWDTWIRSHHTSFSIPTWKDTPCGTYGCIWFYN